MVVARQVILVNFRMEDADVPNGRSPQMKGVEYSATYATLTNVSVMGDFFS